MELKNFAQYVCGNAVDWEAEIPFRVIRYADGFELWAGSAKELSTLAIGSWRIVEITLDPEDHTDDAEKRRRIISVIA